MSGAVSAVTDVVGGVVGAILPTPKMPTMPTLEPVPAAPDVQAEQDRIRANESLSRSPQGNASNMLTGTKGSTSGSTATKTLLGS